MKRARCRETVQDDSTHNSCYAQRGEEQCHFPSETGLSGVSSHGLVLEPLT